MKNYISTALTIIFTLTSYSQASEILFNIEQGCEVVARPSVQRNILEIEGKTPNISFQTRFDESLMVSIFTPSESPKIVERYNSPMQEFVESVTTNQNIYCDALLENIDFKYNWHNIHNSGYIRSANTQSYLDTYGFQNNAKVQFTPASQAKINFNNSGLQDNPWANLIFGALTSNLNSKAVNQVHQAPDNNFIFQKISLMSWKSQARNVPLKGIINFPGNSIDISIQGGKLTLEAAPKYTFTLLN